MIMKPKISSSSSSSFSAYGTKTKQKAQRALNDGRGKIRSRESVGGNYCLEKGMKRNVEDTAHDIDVNTSDKQAVKDGHSP
jgi:hypothetical protein